MGKDEESFEFECDARVADLIRKMIEQYKKDFEGLVVSPQTGEFMTNKIAIGIQREGFIGTKTIQWLNGFDTILKDQDRIVLFLPRA